MIHPEKKKGEEKKDNNPARSRIPARQGIRGKQVWTRPKFSRVMCCFVVRGRHLGGKMPSANTQPEEDLGGRLR